MFNRGFAYSGLGGKQDNRGVKESRNTEFSSQNKYGIYVKEARIKYSVVRINKEYSDLYSNFCILYSEFCLVSSLFS
jgi:hypothetical protein